MTDASPRPEDFAPGRPIVFRNGDRHHRRHRRA